MTDQETADLTQFLNHSLPECLKGCNEYVNKLIADGHKQLEPFLLSKCENVSKEELAKEMATAAQNLEKKINDRFIKRYHEFVENNILIFKDDPCVLSKITKPSTDKYESYNEGLAKEKDDLYQEYIQKQQLLKKLNNETVQLQNDFNNKLQAVSDNYKRMKSEATEAHQTLLNELQTEYDDAGYLHQAQSNNNQAQKQKDAISANDEHQEWGKPEITAVLP